MHTIQPDELMAYLDGELPAERATFAASHLGTCAECQRLAADLRDLSDRMAAWQVEVSVLRAPEVEQKIATGRPWYMWKPLWVMTPVLLLVAFLQFAPRYERARVVRLGLPTAPQAKGRMPKTMNSVGELIAHSANLSLIAGNFDQARDAMQDILKRHHAYIAYLTINAEASSTRTLDATIRTPDSQLDATIRELKSLGRVLQEGRSGEEVTLQSIDLDARLANARNTEQRLTELLKRRTDKLSDVLDVENQISTTRGQIEQMEAERKSLDTRIQYAKLDLRITEVYRSPTDSRLRNAAMEGWRSLGDSLIAVAAFVLFDGPLILLWCAILFFPARYAWRRFRR